MSTIKQICDGGNASAENVRTEGAPAKRGFAALDPDKRRELARMGGVASHLNGTAHEFTSDEARQAGQKGGKAISRNHEHMVEIGRRGGTSRGPRDAARRAKTKSPQV